MNGPLQALLEEQELNPVEIEKFKKDLNKFHTMIQKIVFEY